MSLLLCFLYLKIDSQMTVFHAENMDNTERKIEKNYILWNKHKKCNSKGNGKKVLLLFVYIAIQ